MSVGRPMFTHTRRSSYVALDNCGAPHVFFFSVWRYLVGTHDNVGAPIRPISKLNAKVKETLNAFTSNKIEMPQNE